MKRLHDKGGAGLRKRVCAAFVSFLLYSPPSMMAGWCCRSRKVESQPLLRQDTPKRKRRVTWRLCKAASTAAKQDKPQKTVSSLFALFFFSAAVTVSRSLNAGASQIAADKVIPAFLDDSSCSSLLLLCLSFPSPFSCCPSLLSVCILYDSSFSSPVYIVQRQAPCVRVLG
jgi:hypothetical protein